MIKLIKLWEAGKIVKPVAPILPDFTLRGFGNFHIGERTADAKKGTRRAHGSTLHTWWNPHKYSPKVLYSDLPEDLIGQKIELRWYVPDPDEPVGRYFHSLEGTVKEVIPYSAERPNYREFRLCKYPAALVEWDPIFEYADCHVPLNTNKYNKEDEYCGWNMLNKDHLRQLREVQTAEVEVDEDLRSQVDAANAVLDVTLEAACAVMLMIQIRVCVCGNS